MAFLSSQLNNTWGRQWGFNTLELLPVLFSLWCHLHNVFRFCTCAAQPLANDLKWISIKTLKSLLLFILPSLLPYSTNCSCLTTQNQSLRVCFTETFVPFAPFPSAVSEKSLPAESKATMGVTSCFFFLKDLLYCFLFSTQKWLPHTFCPVLQLFTRGKLQYQILYNG